MKIHINSLVNHWFVNISPNIWILSWYVVVYPIFRPSQMGIWATENLDLNQKQKRLWRFGVIRDNLVWFGRCWMNLHKRSCCSTWLPRKINMEFAKDSRKRIVYLRRMAVPGRRNFDQPPCNHVVFWKETRVYPTRIGFDQQTWGFGDGFVLKYENITKIRGPPVLILTGEMVGNMMMIN